MSTNPKDKKVKSSKADDKKQQKKHDEITIVVDRSNAESTISPSKNDIELNVENSALTDEDLQNQLSNAEAKAAEEEAQKQKEDEKPLSDATKLTEILVER